MAKMPNDNPIKPADAHSWKEFTLYEVNVSYGKHNPMHKAFLFVGFLNNGKPAGYSVVYNSNYESPNNFGEVYCLEVVRELARTN